MRHKDEGQGLVALAKKGRTSKVVGYLIYPVLLVLVFILSDIIVGGGVLTTESLLLLCTHSVSCAYIAWGMFYVWSDGPDFSMAATLILGANLGGILAVELGWGYWGLIGGAIFVCVSLQLVSTAVRMLFKIPAWIGGLGMCMIYEGIGLLYATSCSARGQETVNLGANYCDEIAKQPWNIILLVVGFVVAMLLFSKTSFGVKYRAVRDNGQVAGYMGINRIKIIFIAAAIGSVFVGMASAVQMSIATRMQPVAAMGSIGMISKGLVTNLIAGGMSRKIPAPLAILISAIFVALMFNVLTRLGVASGTWQEFTLGVFVVVFGIFAQRGVKGVVK